MSETRINNRDIKKPLTEENLTLASGISILNSTSGTNNLGTAANPFATVYADALVGASGLGGDFISSTGDTMTGNLTMSGNVVPIASGSNNLGSASKPFNSLFTDNVVVNEITTMNGDLNLGSGVNINVAQSGLGDIGSAAKPLRRVYALNFVDPTSSGTDFLFRSGDSMLGDLTMANGANILAAASGTQDIGNVASPFGEIHANSIYTKNFATPYSNTVKVAPTGADFTSIKEAVESITDASLDNTYVVQVYPGTYSEGPITVTSGISIVGIDQTATIITPTGNHDIVTMRDNSAISFINISNAPAGYCGIRVEDPDLQIGSENYALAHKVSMVDCDTGVMVNNAISGTTLTFYGEYIDNTGENTTTVGFDMQSSNDGFTFANLENMYVFGGDTNPPLGIRVSGVGTSTKSLAFGLDGVDDTGIALQVMDGADFKAQAGSISHWGSGTYVADWGSAPNLELNGLDYIENFSDLLVTHSGATGDFLGFSDYAKTDLQNDNTFSIYNKDRRIVKVSKKGGDFSSIVDALNDISDEGADNRYVLEVGPGSFVEPTIYTRQYIDIDGYGAETIVSPESSGQSIVVVSGNGALSELVLTGSTQSGTSAIVYDCQKIGGHLSLDKITFGSNYSHFTSTTTGTNTATTNVDRLSAGNFAGFTKGFHITNNGTGSNDFVVNNSYVGNFLPPFYPEDIFHIVGSGASLNTSAVSIRSTTALPSGSTTGVLLEDGAEGILNNLSMENLGHGVVAENIGSAPTVRSFGLAAINCYRDIDIQHPDANVSVVGFGSLSSSYINPANTNVSLLGNDPDPASPGTTIVGELFAGETVDSTVEVTNLLYGTTSMGLFKGGEIMASGNGLYITVSGGSAYVQKTPTTTDKLSRFDFDDTQILLPADSENYVYIDTLGTITSDTSPSTINQTVALGRVITNSSGTNFVDPYRFNSLHGTNYHDRYLNETLKARYSTGSIPTESTGTALKIDVPSGRYYYGVEQFNPVGEYEPTFLHYYKSGTDWLWDRTDTVNNTQYNVTASGLVALTPSYYTKHGLYTVGDGVYEDYMVVHGSAEFSGLSLVEADTNPSPPDFFAGSIAKLADIIVLEGSGNIVDFQDKRPISTSLTNIQILGGGGGGGGGVSVHGDLSGLGSDDHAQYLLANGSRAMSGALDMGSQNITTVGTVDGVTVSAHEARHLPNGADPLTTAAPDANLTPNSTNAVGTQNSMARSDHEHAVDLGSPVAIGQAGADGSAASFSRSDHVHAHGNQTGTTMHAVATTGTAGFMSTGTMATLNGKVDKAGDTMTGDLVMAGGGAGIRDADSLIAPGSIAFGAFNAASGVASQAFGLRASGLGNYSFAQGDSVKTTANNSAVFGSQVVNTTANSMLLGYSNGVTLSSGTNLYPEASGTQDLGSPSQTFRRVYADELVDTSGSSIYVEKAGDTMTGALNLASGINLTSTNDFDIQAGGDFSITGGFAGSSIVLDDNATSIKLTDGGNDNYLQVTSSDITMEDQNAGGKLVVAGGVLLDGEGNNVVVSGTLTTSSNILPETSGTQDIGSVALPFGSIYANEIVDTSGSSIYVEKAGDTMTGDLVFNTASIKDSTSFLDSSEKSIAFGASNVASGTNSQAFGTSTKALGAQSHAEGVSTVASGLRAHAEGAGTYALGTNSHSEGASSYATAENSHAEGGGSYADGAQSHAEGSSSVASGLNAHAEGGATWAIGNSSHSEGEGTYAIGNFSHSEGDETKAYGDASHAGGFQSIASGVYSFAHGQQALALASGSFVLSDASTTDSITNSTPNSMLLSFNSGVTLSSGTNLYPETSGIQNIGSPSLPFGTVYATGISAPKNPRSIQWVMDGGGSVLTSGSKGFISVPFSGTPTAWTLMGDVAGTMTVDVRKSTYAGFTGADSATSIVGTEVPALAAVTKNQDTSITTWTAIDAGDIMEFSVSGDATSVTNATLTIEIQPI